MKPEEIKQAFAKIQRRNLIAGVIGACLSGLLLLAFRDSLSPENLLLIVAPMFGILVYVHMVNWRCPVCQAWLGRFFNVRECPGCKANLR